MTTKTSKTDDIEEKSDVEEKLTDDIKNKNIYQKLNYIQVNLEAPKSQYNSFGNYNYRNSEDILSALKEHLEATETIVIMKDEIMQQGDRFYIKATATLLDCESGEKISTQAFAREDESKKGMDLSQVTGSCSSYARKYALNALFAIDDNKDGDHPYPKGDNTDTDNNATRKTSQSNQGKGNSKNYTVTQKQINRLYAMAKSANVNEEQIKKIIFRDYKKNSVKNLTKNEYDDFCSKLENLKNKEGVAS